MLLYLSMALGFGLAMAIGGNDVANSMGTAVGAKAITVKQAVIIAALLEFTGAFFFGSHVTQTITKGILNTSMIDSQSMVLGALAALLGAFIWLIIATIFGLPVSTTHSIVGGMVGYGIVAAGFEAVNWSKITLIVASWFISPFLGAIIAYLMFKIVAAVILRKSDPVIATKKYAPLLISLTFFIIGSLFFIKTLKMGILVSFLISSGIYLVSFLISRVLLSKLKSKNGEMEKYDVVEGVFKKMQIITSCYVSLSHGSNDVANAVGPIAVVYLALTAGSVGSTVAIPSWILAVGGFGIALGVGLWGKKVMTTVGTKITSINNTRGFCIDFSAATTVMIASIFGLPVSTTHGVVGAVTGVGMARGIEGVNRGVLKNIVWAWLVTVPVAALTSAAVFYFIR